MTATGRLLAFDVGNTRIKAGVFEGLELRRVFTLETGGYADVSLDDVLREEVPDPPSVVILGSVVRDVSGVFASSVNRVWSIELIEATPELPLGLQVDVPDPMSVGIDRLLLAGEAFALTGKPTIVVGTGTAITLDVVGGDGVYRGGTISAGLGLSAWALAERTSLLPEVSTDSEPGTVPQTTEANLQTGLLIGAAGSVDRLVHEMASRAGFNQVDVILTGGDAARLSGHLKTPHRIVIDLVLKGLARTAARMFGSADS